MEFLCQVWQTAARHVHHAILEALLRDILQPGFLFIVHMDLMQKSMGLEPVQIRLVMEQLCPAFQTAALPVPFVISGAQHPYTLQPGRPYSVITANM